MKRNASYIIVINSGRHDENAETKAEDERQACRYGTKNQSDNNRDQRGNNHRHECTEAKQEEGRKRSHICQT